MQLIRSLALLLLAIAGIERGVLAQSATPQQGAATVSSTQDCKGVVDLLKARMSLSAHAAEGSSAGNGAGRG